MTRKILWRMIAVIYTARFVVLLIGQLIPNGGLNLESLVSGLFLALVPWYILGLLSEIEDARAE